MKEQDYMTERVDDQYNWLDRKASWNQKRYKRIRAVVITVSVLIPLASGFISDEMWWLKIAVGAGGALVAIFEGITAMQKYQELWLQYRMTAEALKREKFLFQTKAGKYHTAQNPFNEFVLNVETLLAGENASWVQQMSKKESEEKGDA